MPPAASRSPACFKSSRRVSDIRGFSGQEFRLVLRHQRQDQFLQSRPFHDLVELIKGKIDTVVGDPPLRKIIGADALGAVTGPYLSLALGGTLGIDAVAFQIIEPRRQE